jgi:hypothetical protein
MTWQVKYKAKKAMRNPHGTTFELTREFYDAVCKVAGPSDPGFWLDFAEFELHDQPDHDQFSCDKCGCVDEQWGWYMPWYLEPFGLLPSGQSREHIIVIFKQRDHALLFKLTHGGDLVEDI